jgi:hypothetical protein
MKGLNKEQIKQYQQIHEECYRKPISEVEAYKEATKLLNLCRVLIKHSAKNHKDEKAET